MTPSRGNLVMPSAFALVWGLVFCAAAGGVEFAGGTGGPNDPYLVATAEQLLSIGLSESLLDKHYLLVASIDLSGIILTEAPISRFNGTFDGSGYTIRNLRIEGEGGAGLFYMIRADAEVRNLGLVNVQIVGGSGCGALASGNSGRVVNCYSTGAVIGAVPQEERKRPSGRIDPDYEPTTSSIGGLLGQNYQDVVNCYSTATVVGGNLIGGLIGVNMGNVSGCHATGEVTGVATVGGLIGLHNNKEIVACYSLASVAAQSRVAGGLVGFNCNGRITSCYSGATVVGRGDSAGGLVAQNQGRITSCYANGSVTGEDLVGGLAGESNDTIIACYAAARVTGETQRVGALVGTDWDEYPVIDSYYLNPADDSLDNEKGVSLTDAQMRRQSSFAGFDFCLTDEDGKKDFWFMPEGGYPVLAWQANAADLRPIPQILGMPLEEAEAALEAAGLTVGEISYDFYRNIPPGCVINTDPRWYAAPGDAIDLCVSLEGTYDWTKNPGDGSAAYPYQIETPGQLESLADDPELLDKHFILVADLDMAGRMYQLALIAPDTERTRDYQGTPFTGSFDGQRHDIRNLFMHPFDERESVDYVGLFGMIAKGGLVENVRLLDADVRGGSSSLNYVAILVAYNTGTVQNCTVTGFIYGGSGNGLVGYSLRPPTGCHVDVVRLL